MRTIRKLVNNHLKNGYSNFNLSFLKKYVDQLNRHSKILDVGCGHYRNLNLFKEVGFRYLYGIDINNPEPLYKINVEFIQGDIKEGVPYADKEFDVVLCNYVLMFIPKNVIRYVIIELLRVTNKFLIIELNQKKENTINSDFEDYDFREIVSIISAFNDFEIIEIKKYVEKILVKRI